MLDSDLISLGWDSWRVDLTERLRNVLVIDDLRAFQVTLKGMLLNMGATRIDFCDSGEQALRDINRFDYDLIISDYNLGSQRKNGRQLLEELKARELLPSTTLFVIVTGENTRAMVLGALENQPDDYVMKPFSHQQLSARLHRALEKRIELQAVYDALAVKNYPTAIAACRERIEAGSRYSNFCLCLMAELYCTTGDYAKSEKMLRHFLAERDTTWTRVALARTLVKSGQHEEAETLLQELVAAQPLLLDALDLLSENYAARGQIEEAIATIKAGTEISPLGILRQQRLAAMAVEIGDFELASQAFCQVYELSRYSVHHSVDHMCDYVRILFEAADRSPEPSRQRRLENEAFTVLSRARSAGSYPDFDFPCFEGVCQARLQAQRGELVKAKKTFYKAAERYFAGNDFELPDVFLAEGVSTMAAIGEYEMAIEMAERLEKLEQRCFFAQSALSDFRNNDDANESLKIFEKANREGIAHYTRGELAEAIKDFRLALTAAPTNTGVALNLIQSLLELSRTKRKSDINELTECRETFKLLDGVPLPDKQKQRHRELKQGFDALMSERR